MHIKSEFAIGDVETARSIVRGYPFATIVTSDLRATHMPCLVDESSQGPDDPRPRGARRPGRREARRTRACDVSWPVRLHLSASWYASDTIPTWNHITLHLRGTPELFDDAMPILRRTVDTFESAVEEPGSLERMGDTAREMADQVIAFRLTASSWHLEAKLSQDKPEDERARVLAGVESHGPYANSALAEMMRRFWP